MGRCVAHRGTDEDHVWVGGPCGLTHQRLRIIDLSPDAAQPMSNEDGRLRLVFNGEIYNFQNLRKELLAEGHRFRSRSDTEVILHGYEKWGLDVFSKLRGMFAIALWDEREQSLVLGRDRFGKKPLFYALGEGWLAFGSELSVFRPIPFLKFSLCGDSLREYAEYGYVNDPRTILKEVHRLSPGHCALWNRSGLQTRPFWRLPLEPFPSRPEGGVPEAADALEPALREAVACRLVSDVPLGCFLSGGVDSSLVSALAQESMSERLKTYSVGFADSNQSEAAHAAAVARHLGTDHHELMVRPAEVLSEFEAILSKLSEPLADDSFVPTYLISRETRRHVTVVLTGDGGDELFCGYTKYRQFDMARRLPPWLRKLAGSLRRLTPGDKARKILGAFSAGNDLELARWLSSLWKRDEMDLLLAPPFRSPPPLDVFAQKWESRGQFPNLERWMLTDMETYMEGDILTKVDRASMAVALETRSPFLDHLFVEQALRWTSHARVKDGGKEILRRMLARRLPAKLFARPKQGFGMPIEEWYRGPLRDLLVHYTQPDRIRRRGVFHADTVEAMMALHLAGRRNFARKLHAIVAFEIWADRFFGKGQALA